MMSACVKWAKFHVDEHNAVLATQLSSTEKGSQDWIDCMETARQHSHMLLSVGLRFQPELDAPIDRNSPNPVGLGLK
jgi:hypothetical protein